MTSRENLLRALRFEGPERIPVRCSLNAACWYYYEHADLFDLMERHPVLFPAFRRPTGQYSPSIRPWQRAGQPYRDPWGCVSESSEEGISGAVFEHPLADWRDFAGYLPPDPYDTNGRGPPGSMNWETEERILRRRKREGRLAVGGLPHGHTFLRLLDIRGYENLMFDMADDEPLLRELIGMIESFNLYVVRRYIAMDVDQLGYPEDLGMQRGPMLSPDHFRKYIKPVYARLISPAREAGIVVHMHSDGDVRDLAGDLLDLGIDCLNIQDLVNGIDWIRDNLKGRVCIDLDIDRQAVVRFGTPKAIEKHIREAVKKLSAPEGGLMMTAGIYPGIPLDNLRTLMNTLESL